MKKVAILQSNYIPWKGYFDLIAAVDEFVIYDDAQYTKNDWRNRNQIKTPQGLSWLTIPIVRDHQPRIRDARIDGNAWAEKHWRTLAQNYRRAPHFDEIATWLEPMYLRDPADLLSPVNRQFMEAICSYLDVSTTITNSWDYELGAGQTERLVSLCEQAGAGEYISGPAAKSYVDEDLFRQADVKLTWFDYDGYPEYPQLWGGFEHGVSILDLLFNCGTDAPEFMRYVQR